MEHALLYTYCVCYNNFILKQTYLHCYRCLAEANWHQKPYKMDFKVAMFALFSNSIYSFH